MIVVVFQLKIAHHRRAIGVTHRKAGTEGLDEALHQLVRVGIEGHRDGLEALITQLALQLAEDAAFGLAVWACRENERERDHLAAIARQKGRLARGIDDGELGRRARRGGLR